MLTELQIKAARPKDKPYYLSDGRGLILLVKPNGSKCWIARIYEGGKEKRRGLGTWPEVPLKKARELCGDIKRAPAERAAPRFADIAAEWYDTQIAWKSPAMQASERSCLNKHILPALGAVSVDAITPGQCLDICQRICDAGHLSAARITRQTLVRVLDFAVIAGHIPANPAAAIRRVLPAPPEKHFAALSDPADISALLGRISHVSRYLVQTYIFLLIYTFVRPAELLGAKWREISGDFWTVPAERMKGRKDHVVPLAPQVRQMLAELKARNVSEVWLFPGRDGDKAPVSIQTIRYAMRSAGYPRGSITLHGFRAMASTVLNSAGFAPDVIEAQLAHVDRSRVRRAYNRAEYLPQRVELMTWYAGYLDKLKAGQIAPPVL